VLANRQCFVNVGTVPLCESQILTAPPSSRIHLNVCKRLLTSRGTSLVEFLDCSMVKRENGYPSNVSTLSHLEPNRSQINNINS
jgi:hypothetical protein